VSLQNVILLVYGQVALTTISINAKHSPDGLFNQLDPGNFHRAKCSECLLGCHSCQLVKQAQTNVSGIIFIFVIGFLMMRIEVTLVCLAFNHIRWLVAQQSFISIRVPSVSQQAPAAMCAAEYKHLAMVGCCESSLSTAQ
jgi:hypothetical protein